MKIVNDPFWDPWIPWIIGIFMDFPYGLYEIYQVIMENPWKSLQKRMI